MPRIAFIGAGSAVFTRNLVGDVLSVPELGRLDDVSLMDIDAERLGRPRRSCARSRASSAAGR